MSGLETRFAKVVRTPDGWDCILIEGEVITLDIEDADRNRILVDQIVKGLRNQGDTSGFAQAYPVRGSASDLPNLRTRMCGDGAQIHQDTAQARPHDWIYPLASEHIAPAMTENVGHLYPHNGVGY